MVTAAGTPSPLLRAAFAPAERTLVDIFRVTLRKHAEATALDNGADQLTYEELAEAAEAVADELAELGIGAGDKVGIRLPSGTTDLYIAIIATLLAGAAYVPVDADDPDERARLVFAEARVAAVIGADLAVEVRGMRPPREREQPTPDDDAWVIFTSGSTGTPKGVAVTHRNAAAFVDAESRLFLQEHPLGPDDRVMAGLSVAFDASCEEMWLAWRYGACLVPAPRALVQTGADVGAVAGGQPGHRGLDRPDAGGASGRTESLAEVRLLILGGEACPPELAARLVASRPRGLEHVRPDRGHRGGLRRAAHRRGAGADRPAAGRMGPRGRRRRRPPRRRGRDG